VVQNFRIGERVSMCLVSVGCADDQFQCETSGLCIPATWICNGDPDCTDYSDERGCASKS